MANRFNGAMSNEKARVFVEGTQRGYAVGTRRGKRTIRETHFSDRGGREIDRAYRDAREFAIGLENTLKLKPSLLREQGWL